MTMDNGWIRLHKRFLQWEWLDKPEMVQLFLYLLLKANFAEAEWHGVKLNRGQLITSASSIERDLRLSPRTIRTCLNRLKSTREVTIETTNRFSIITILKYEDYQSEQNEDDKQNNRRIDSLPTNNRQASDKRPTIDKEEKEEKEYNITSSDEEVTSGTKVPEALKSEEPESEEAQPFRKIRDDWNVTCTAYPKLQSLSESRKNKLRNHIAEMGGSAKALPLLHEIFEKMMASSFLRGDNKRGWRASFDWLITNDKNWVKVNEGNYDDRKSTDTQMQKFYGATQNNRQYYDPRIARQQEFARHVADRLAASDQPELDLSGNY